MIGALDLLVRVVGTPPAKLWVWLTGWRKAWLGLLTRVFVAVGWMLEAAHRGQWVIVAMFLVMIGAFHVAPLAGLPRWQYVESVERPMPRTPGRLWLVMACAVFFAIFRDPLMVVYGVGWCVELCDDPDVKDTLPERLRRRRITGAGAAA